MSKPTRLVRDEVSKRLKDIYQISTYAPEQQAEIKKHTRNVDRVLAMLVTRPKVTVQFINESLRCNDGGRYVRFLSEAGFEIERNWVTTDTGAKSFKEYNLTADEKARILTFITND